VPRCCIADRVAAAFAFALGEERIDTPSGNWFFEPEAVPAE